MSYHAWGRGLSEARQAGARRGVAMGMGAAYTACAKRGEIREMARWGGVRARHMHRNERKGAARVDGDAIRVIELGDSAVAVEEARRAAAGERGGLPGGDVDTADAVVQNVLRCIMGGHTEEELNRRSGRTVWCGSRCGPYLRPTPCARRVCRLRDGGMRGRLTHADEREGAARVDRDATRVMELGAVAGAVEEARGAAAGKDGGRPGGNIDTADAVVPLVLRCIMGERAEKEL